MNDPGESATSVSASLTWTGPTNRAFIGYNVYRGGVKITPTPITNASFTDLGLARNTTYSYTVKSVYDEGESAASNTVSITTKGVGTFNGFVYDALTSAPIEGATVKITGSAGDYTVTTTANGAYSTLAYKGSYNFTVSATDYNSQTVSNVSLNHGATVSRNFYLSETPFPVGEVIAFELNDNSTQVSWSGTAPSPIELVKLTQNPGLPENAYYEYFDMGYGVVYDLLAYPDASISSMNFHHASWGTYGTWQYKIHVYNWDTKTLIGTYGPFNTTGNDKWESGVNLGNVSAGGAGLVAIIMEPLGNVYDDAFPNLSSDNDVVNPQGSIFGELNDPAGMATSTIGNFLMELYIYTAQGTRATAPRYVDFGKAVNAPNRMNTTAEASKPVINQTSLSITKGEETFTNRTVVGPSYYTDATRGIVSYDVWREKAFQPGALVKIGNTFSEDFVDFDWGNMGWGVYRWGVTVNYDAGQVSAITYSNTLDKDMEIAVDVAVALNSSESPGGTSVTFTNTSEPDLELVYNTVLDNSGAFAWDAFRRGVYNIQVMHPGYAVVAETGVEIFDDASFEWLLEELLAAPGNLYVTPTAFATWNLGGGGGGGGAFEPFMESFDGLANGEIPAGWTRSPDVVRWGAFASSNAGGTSPEMRFGWSPSITAEFSVMTPSINTSGQTQLTLSFDNYLWHYSSSYEYSVKVVAIADGVQHIIQAWDPVTANIPKGLLSYDLTAAQGVGASDFKIAWIFDGNTMGTFYWYFDNVMLNGSRAKAGRSFATNKVFLDGQLITETTDNEYQYDVATLTPYETYTAGVAAVYATGQSPTAEFDFIYVPCGDYDVPTAFAATQVEGTLNIMLDWTNVDAAALDTISALRIYRNGTLYKTLDFEDAAVDTYLDANLDFGMYTYCVTYIYDSGAETCQGVTCSDEVEIDGNAGVNGMVTKAAYLGGGPVSGASVLLVNVDNPATTFEFTTNATGFYEGMVIAGTYDYTVSANGYTSVMLEDVVIVLNATVTNDFELIEFPYPPILVQAEE
ncbi:MAG: carboxypeptidase regulatory-like domain-containing protein, partial [Lysobacteraceae bacterium]